MAYAHRNRQRYLDWAGGVAASPFDTCDMMEWAVITAHTPFSVSIVGFEATRGVSDVVEYATKLQVAGVLAAGNKAARCLRGRELLQAGAVPLPSHDYREWRRTYKLPGLGLCKASFFACLVAPLDADIVCLDTHMLQALTGGMPTAREVRRIYGNRADYEYWESVLVLEADAVGLPAFPYQWAVWDHQRARVRHVPPTDHSFLWPGGASQHQLPLFTHLEAV